ncbi:SMAKA protein, partial [Polyodon spathula]|nr:SMAKA protein [Polyodon spathula]
MGCIKSKHSNLAENANLVEKTDSKENKSSEDKTALVNSELHCRDNGSALVNPMLLDYAQRLSEEIVRQAVQQWAVVDSRYSNIPYIESDMP